MKTAKLLIYSLILSIIMCPVVYSQNDNNDFDFDRKHFHDWNDDYCECRAMHNSDFQVLKKVINDRWFESDRINFAKNAIYDNYFSVSQVKELLNIMWFEDSKLELAKLAYTKTVNKKKYYQLYDVFWFESSVTELDNFIRNYKY